MSVEHRFTSTPVRHQPLQVFLQHGHAKFLAEPARLLQPLILALHALHQSGQAHGAVTPSSILVAPSGEIDLAFFKARSGSPEPIEAPGDSPEGAGDDINAFQRMDQQALGAVLHGIVTNQPPASPAGRTQRLADQQAAKDWPTDFIVMLDRLRDVDSASDLPTLLEISNSLNPPTSVREISEIAVPRLPVIRLANGRVGRAFSAELTPSDHDSSSYRIEPISDIPPGLEIHQSRLVGTPETAGEFQIQLRIQPAVTELEAYEQTLNLTINSDPRSLWKNTPSDAHGEFWKPDAAIDFLTSTPLSVLGASLRGRSHAHVGTFRDDDMAMRWFPANSWYSLTVADGAGSAKYSRQGSKIACDSVQADFEKYFSTGEDLLSRQILELAQTPDAAPAVKAELYDLFVNAAFQARKAVDAQALAVHASARDFHTTLITALLHPLDDGRWFIATFAIGDGAAAILSASGDPPCLLTRPDSGDYAGQTIFLTMNEAFATGEAIMSRIQMAIIPDFDALLLVTDGISDPRFDSENELADPTAWAALWDELKKTMLPATSLESAAHALLQWMEFHSPGHHDDRTLVLASRSSIFTQP
jgi:serine/threonine protein phosphatase PrpC